METRTILILMLVFAAILVAPSFHHPTTRLTNTSYSSIHILSGNTMVIENENATISGTVTVDTGGTLIIRNSIVWINYSSSNVFWISGELIIENSELHTINTLYTIYYNSGGSGHIQNVTFNGLYILYLYETDDCYVKDSTFYMGGNTIYIYESNNVTVEGNTFRAYAYAWAYYAVIASGSNVTIRNNDIYSEREFGKMITYGISIYQSNFTIENNVVEASYCGIAVNNGNGTIRNNTIFSKNDGILLSLNVYSHVNVTGNLIEGATYGVYGSFGESWVTDNTIIGVKYGIYISSVYLSTRIENNKIVRATRVPVRLKSEDAEKLIFSGNTVDEHSIEVYINSTETIEDKDLGSLIIINSTSINIRKCTIHGSVEIVNSLVFLDNTEISTVGSAFYGREEANVSISDSTITANEYIFAGYFNTISIGGSTLQSNIFANNYDFLSIATSTIHVPSITLDHADIIRSTLYTDFITLYNDTTFDHSDIKSSNALLYFDSTPDNAYLSSVSTNINDKPLLIMVNQSGTIPSGDYGYILLVNSNLTGTGITTKGLEVLYGVVDIEVSVRSFLPYPADATAVYLKNTNVTLRNGGIECSNIMALYGENSNVSLLNMTVKSDVYALGQSDSGAEISNSYIRDSYVDGPVAIDVDINGNLTVENSVISSQSDTIWATLLSGTAYSVSIINSELTYSGQFISSSASTFYVANYSGTTINGHEIEQYISESLVTINGGNKFYLLYNVSHIDVTGEIAGIHGMSCDEINIHSATIHEYVDIEAQNITISNTQIKGDKGLFSNFQGSNVSISDTVIDTLFSISTSVTHLSVTDSTHDGKPIYAKINSSATLGGDYGIIIILNQFNGTLKDATAEEIYIKGIDHATINNIKVHKYLYLLGKADLDGIYMESDDGLIDVSIEGTVTNAKFHVNDGYISLGSGGIYKNLDLYSGKGVSLSANITIEGSKIDVNYGIYGSDALIYKSEIWVRCTLKMWTNYYFIGDNGKYGNTWYMYHDYIQKYTFDGVHGKYVLLPSGLLARYATVMEIEAGMEWLWIVIIIIITLAVVGIVITIIKRRQVGKVPPTGASTGTSTGAPTEASTGE